MRFKLLAAITSVLVLLAHLAGLFLNFYVKFPNYDMLVHFLGGMWVASSFVFLMKYTLKSDILDGSFFMNLLIVCGVTALAAVLWEFFEFYTNILGNLPPNTYTDTLSDLAFGILGAVVAGVVVLPSAKKTART